MSNSSTPSNRLIHEKSPYLLQHAHNPVDWYPWGKEAIKRAQELDRPVLLSVGYSTCHWCHVMAHESFEDNSIAQMINDHFVAVKVDREERPDIDQIYMAAVSAMSGQGGWPLTVFLTPKLEPFYGGTYFPPYAKWGSPGFKDLLESVSAAWKSDRERILISSREITQALRNTATTGTVSAFDVTLIDKAYSQLKAQFDTVNGGFGSAPKFPMGHNLSFLLRYDKFHAESGALRMAEQTLTAMRRGGIYDQLGGGFHRYSTDPNWHVPHFEKMLYDQALLSRAYLEGYLVTKNEDHANTAREIFDHVLGVMTSPQGGFYSAQDADSPEVATGHAKEGAFYCFTELEMIEVLGVDTAAIFNYCYGLLPDGNVVSDPLGEFKGKNILYLAHEPLEAARQFDQEVSTIKALLLRARNQLLAYRQQRPRLHVDDKILTSWNGLMIASMSFGGRVLQEPKYLKAAARAADFIMDNLMVNGRLLHRWRDGSAGIQATLEDQAFFIYGLLDLYETTFEEKYFQAAEDLAVGLIDLFADEAGGFYMTARDAENLIVRLKEVYDGALPSGNSVAALVLLRLYALTQKELYQLRARGVLGYFANSVGLNPHAYTFWLSALDWHLQGAMEITFQGTEDDVKVAKMLKVLYKYFIPYRAVKLMPAATPSGVRICYRGTCYPLADNLEKIL